MGKDVKKLALSAMFLALGLVLPLVTGNLQVIGSMLLPMHLPVLLCGLICGWKHGGVVGLVLPLLRCAIFGMPPLYPTAIAMTFELATYGAVVGLIFQRSPWQCVRALYRALLAAMVAGRLVWGAARVILMGLGNSTFSWQAFLSGALLTAIPGIILQLVLIPSIMLALDRTHLVPFRRGNTEAPVSEQS